QPEQRQRQDNLPLPPPEVSAPDPNS
ncbi:hypothetical protein LCGC14_2927510, partial [marine sediment metagenome]